MLKKIFFLLFLFFFAWFSCDNPTVKNPAMLISSDYWGGRKSTDSCILIRPYKKTEHYLFCWVYPHKKPVEILAENKHHIEKINPFTISFNEDSFAGNDYKQLSADGTIRLISQIQIVDDSFEGILYTVEKGSSRLIGKLPARSFFDKLSDFSRLNDSIYRQGEEKLYEAFAGSLNQN